MKLAKGINLGGWLSQCDYTEERYSTFIKEEDIAFIAHVGYDHVRVPIDYPVFQTEQGWGHVDDAVNWTKKYGLDIILDLHRAEGYDFNNAIANAVHKEENDLLNNENLQAKFIELWKQIITRYCMNEHVVFELLNEVAGEGSIEPWNELIKKSVKAIREITADSIIMYGGSWFNSVLTIPTLEKPLDKNIVWDFHYYNPEEFTHQKAEWAPNWANVTTTEYPNSKWPESYHEERIIQAVEHARKMGVQLYCGEFGVIKYAPADSAWNWFKDVLAVFDKYDIGYGVWTYRDMHFGMNYYDEDMIYKIVGTK